MFTFIDKGGNLCYIIVFILEDCLFRNGAVSQHEFVTINSSSAKSGGERCPMPPNVPRVASSGLSKLYLTEASGFISGRLGELIFKAAPPALISKAAGMVPDGILDTPDRQKSFAFALGMFALTLSQSAAVAQVTEKFLIESLEELALRKGELVGNDAKKTAIIKDVFNKHAAPIDALRASMSRATAPGRNLWDTLAVLSADKQTAFWDWFQLQEDAFRKEVHESGAGIVVSEERLLSFISAPDKVKAESMEHLLRKSPKLGPGKSALERFFGDIRGKGEKYLEPDGPEMQDFAAKATARATDRNDRIKARRRLF